MLPLISAQRLPGLLSQEVDELMAASLLGEDSMTLIAFTDVPGMRVDAALGTGEREVL